MDFALTSIKTPSKVESDRNLPTIYLSKRTESTAQSISIPSSTIAIKISPIITA